MAKKKPQSRRRNNEDDYTKYIALGEGFMSGVSGSKPSPRLPEPTEEDMRIPTEQEVEQLRNMTRMWGAGGAKGDDDAGRAYIPLSARLAFNLSDRQIEEDYRAGAKGGSEFGRAMTALAGSASESVGAINRALGSPLPGYEQTEQMAEAAREEGGIGTQVGSFAGYALDPAAYASYGLLRPLAVGARLTAPAARIGASAVDEALLGAASELPLAMLRGDPDPKLSALGGGAVGGVLEGVTRGAGRAAGRIMRRSQADEAVPTPQQATQSPETAPAASEPETTPTTRQEPEAVTESPVESVAQDVPPEARPRPDADTDVEDVAARPEEDLDPERARSVEAMRAEGVPDAEARALMSPDMELGAGLTPDSLKTVVSDAVRAGKWTARASASAARLAWEVAGDGFRTMRDFAQGMMREFGRGIRRFIPDAWQSYKALKRPPMRRAPANRPDADQPAGADAETSRRERQAFRRVLRDEASNLANSAFPDRPGVARSLAARAEGIRSQSGLDRFERHVRKLREVAEGESGPAEAKRLISKAFGKSTNKTSLRKAANNTDFDEDFDAIRELGIENPRQVPKAGDLAKLSPERRLEVVAAYDALRSKFRAYRSETNVISAGRKAGSEVAREISSKGGKTLPVGRQAGPRRTNIVKSFLRESSLQPERLAERLGRKAQQAIYEPVRKAKEAYYATYRSLQNDMRRRLSASGINADDAAQMRQMSGPKAPLMDVRMGGKTFSMTRAEFQYLLATLTDSDTLERISDGSRVALGRDRTTTVKLTDDDISAIDEMATEQDWAAVAAIKKTINVEAQPLLNKTNREMRGYDLTDGREDYFPISRDAVHVADDSEDLFNYRQDGRVENRPFTKERDPRAKAPILIHDIYATADRHIAQVAAVSQMARPVQQVRATLNTRSFRDAVERQYGKAMNEQLAEWVQEVVEDAGRYGRGIGETDSFMLRLVSNVGVGVLGANPAVVLKQLPSFVNATTEIDAKYMAQGASAAFSPSVRARMLEHSPNIWARYNLHTSRIIGDMRAETEAVAKVRSFSETMMKGITEADKSVVTSIWRASELKVKAEKPDLDGDRYWEAVNEESDRVIRRTQPNFDMVNASSIQRKGRKNWGWRSISMFMSQRNTNYNMLYSALASGDTKRIAKVLAVVGLVQPAMISAVDELRDQIYGRADDDREFEDFVKGLAVDVISNNLSQIYGVGAFAEPKARRFMQNLLGIDGYVFDYSIPVLSVAESFAQQGVTRAAEGMLEGDLEKFAKGLERIVLDGAALKGIPIRAPYSAVENTLLEEGVIEEIMDKPAKRPDRVRRRQRRRQRRTRERRLERRPRP